MIKLIGGPAAPVYVITSSDLKQNGGRFQLEGGAAVPVYNLGESGVPTRFGDVQNGDYAEFDENGFLFFYGNARGWMDYNFGINALALGAAAPDRIDLATTNIEVLGFDGVNTTEEVSVSLELNHNWDEGTILKPHIHWLPTTNDAGNVHWQLEYVIVQDEDVVSAGTTIEVTQAAAGVAWTQQFASFPDIAASGYTIGAQAFFRLFRDPTDDDTYGADAALATFGVHALINSIGSRQVGVK